MFKVMDGARPVRRYKRRLRKKGLQFKQTGKGKSGGYFFTEDAQLEGWLLRFCADHKLRFNDTNSLFGRSENYRRQFLTHNRGYRNDGIHYHCAYCGKRLRPDTLEVDHIIPVHAAETKMHIRLIIRLLRLKSVNDTRNLTASCHRCNRKKSDKAGLWMIQGYIGKHHLYWVIRRCVVICAIVFLLAYLHRTGLLNETYVLFMSLYGQ